MSATVNAIDTKPTKKLKCKFMVYPSSTMIDDKKMTQLKIPMDNEICKTLTVASTGSGRIDKEKYKNPYFYLKNLNINVPDVLYEYSYKIEDNHMFIYSHSETIARIVITEMIIDQNPNVSFTMCRFTELNAYETQCASDSIGNDDVDNVNIGSMNMFGEEGTGDY
jgi:hypothetical protein